MITGATFDPRSVVRERYGDPVTGILHPIGEAVVEGCHCKNCDRRWVDFPSPPPTRENGDANDT